MDGAVATFFLWLAKIRRSASVGSCQPPRIVFYNTRFGFMPWVKECQVRLGH